MKKDIHPTYYPDAQITCACGASFTVGSTEKTIHVEVCSMCHPYYTGKEKLMDTAGRVDRFRARMAAAEGFSKKAKAGPAKKEPKIEANPEQPAEEQTSEDKK